jgi:hypothetical protein
VPSQRTFGIAFALLRNILNGGFLLMEAQVIRKISSGQYRLYSRKKNPKMDAGGTSEPFELARQLKLTSERSNTSKDTE